MAPPSILERLSLRSESIQARLLELCEEGRLRGALLIPTCNRLEVLLELADEVADEDADALVPDLLGGVRHRFLPRTPTTDVLL